MKHFPFLFLALLLLSYKPSNKKTLLLAEYDVNTAKNHLQYLVSYTFIDGVMTSKEKLMVIPTQKQGVQGDYVRFDRGKNKLYRNRYIVSGIGNVIDLQQKKILLAEKDNFVAFKGDSIIFHTNDIFKGEYYSVFDLKTEQYKRVFNTKYDPLGIPDVEVDITTKPLSIAGYFMKGQKEVLVPDAGYGEAGTDPRKILPLFWLDKKSFLYANYSLSQDAAIIYKVSIDKSVDKIGEIPAIPKNASNAFFEYGVDSSIIYSCDKGGFTIDIANKKIVKRLQEVVGNKFTIDSDENQKYGRIIKYNSEIIGKKWCHIDNAQSIPEYLAVQNDMVMDGERYQMGVAVWSVQTKKWTQIEATSLSNIIGWIEE